MPLLGSGSRLYRTLMCPAAAQLPQEDKPAGAKAIKGQALHRYYELRATLSHLEAQEIVEAEYPDLNIRTTLNRIKHDPFYRHDGAQYEVKLVYHGETHTASILEAEGAREYGDLGPLDIPLTADQALLTDYLAVGDLKTGDPRWVEPAETNSQLWLASLCVSKITGVTEGEQWIEYLKGYGKTEIDKTPVTAQGLAQFEGLLQSSLEFAVEVSEYIAEDLEPPVFPEEGFGGRCTFCKARKACPAFQGDTNE